MIDQCVFGGDIFVMWTLIVVIVNENVTPVYAGLPNCSTSVRQRTTNHRRRPMTTGLPTLTISSCTVSQAASRTWTTATTLNQVPVTLQTSTRARC